MNNSLYSLLEMKSKNSIMKSVFITNKKAYDGLPIIEVEPYDQTFLNATNTINKYNDTVDRIIKKVHEYFNGVEVWINVYTDNHGSIELLINDYYMSQWS